MGSKSTQVTTTDSIRELTATKQYTYVGVLTGQPAYSQSRFSPQVAIEQTVATYDWGSTGTPLDVVIKAWYDQDELACEFHTLSGSLVSGHFYQYAAGAQVADDKEYGFGQIANPALTCTGVGTNTSRGPVPPAPTSPTPLRETVLQFQSFTNPLGSTFVVPQSQTVSFNGTKISETDSVYDSASLVPVSAVQHDEVNYSASVLANRANLTSVTRKCLSGCTTDSVNTATYDETGQMSSLTDGCGNAPCSDMTATNHTTVYSYQDAPLGGNAGGNSNAYLTQVTDPLGHVQSSTYNYVTGELASATDPNNNTTNYTYADPLNRLTQVQGPPNSNNGGQRPTTTYCYYDVAPRSIPCPNSVAPPPSVTTTTIASPDPSIVNISVRDGMGHVVQTQISSDPAGADVVDTVYNGVGGVYSVSNPHRPGPSPTDGTTIFTYNALGQKVIQTNPDGSMNQWCYNGVASQGQTNCSANASSMTSASWVDFADENNVHRQSVSDSFGRLTAQMEPNPTTGALGAETDYSYDALNNLVGTIQNGMSGEVPRSRGFLYDSLSRLTSSTNPETGTVCYGQWSGSNCNNGYDANGNLSYKTDARGQTVSYHYDALNRMISKSASDGSFTYSYGYDDPAKSYGIGRLTHSTNNVNAASDYYYDQMGRVVAKIVCVPTNCNYVFGGLASYDLAGNMTNSHITTGADVGSSFDAAGHLSGSTFFNTGLAAPIALRSNMVYGPVGVTQARLGNGLREETGYDNRMRVNAFSVSPSSSPQSGGYPPTGYIDYAWNAFSQQPSLAQGGLRSTSRLECLRSI